MGNRGKVLVAYSTRYGSTGEIAAVIADAIREKGIEAELWRAKEVDDLSGYSGVVLGSPVFVGRWMGEATDFVKRHRESLKDVSVSYFTVGLLLREESERGLGEHTAVLEKVKGLAPEVSPVETGMFAGAVDKSKMGFFIRWWMTLMHAKEGDFRDWAAIRTWARDVADKMSNISEEAPLWEYEYAA